MLSASLPDLLEQAPDRSKRSQRCADYDWMFGRADVQPGETVIHIEHGLAIFEGRSSIEVDDEAHEIITLRYRKGGKLMLPADEMKLVFRHGGDPDGVSLDRLKNSDWVQRRDAMIEEMRGSAARLLASLRERMTATTEPLVPIAQHMEAFAAEFTHKPTEDQERAFAAIAEDLAQMRPMERLVVGDVGFGKTEVAARAIAAAVFSKRQAVVAVPTTVLARQHVECFRERFAKHDIRIAEWSRLIDDGEREATRNALATGEVDVLVGTHGLTTSDLEFADLGLVIIDEEHKFGTKRKRALRDYQTRCHRLTLTATPIPSTMAAAEYGLRDVSVLATAPAARKPVRCKLLRADDEGTAIRALTKEKARGGQSYVVCPRVGDMDALAEWLAKAVPELDVAVAHGQVDDDELERTMLDFADGASDVLLCTAIVESGLDVPNANTMLVTGAERFGLAQLHQLRGRIGRSGRDAHCLLRPSKPLDDDAPAIARLEALVESNELGSGFAIARADSALRGSGEPGTDAQSGHVSVLGTGLYRHLLRRELERQLAENPST